MLKRYIALASALGFMMITINSCPFYCSVQKSSRVAQVDNAPVVAQQAAASASAPRL